MNHPNQANNDPRRRFVVLRHTDRQGTHFDLMIDQKDGLATWKFTAPPEQAPRGPLPCTRIADHRRTYLDYEGPVSGDRGGVVRHDAGTACVSEKSPDRWAVEFRGARLQGTFILERLDDELQSWGLRSAG